MVDIRPPRKKNFPDESAGKSRSKSLNNGYFANLKISATVLACLIIFGIFNFIFDIRHSLASVSFSAANLKLAAIEMKFPEIKTSLFSLNQEIKNLADKIGLMKYLPVLRKFSDAADAAAGLSETAVSLAADADYLRENGIQLILKQKGGELIARLERINADIEKIEKFNAELNSESSELGSLSPKLASLSDIFKKNYAPIGFNLHRAKEFLNSLLDMLRSDEDRHILLIFQNESEMRPAGGFIGSFGDLTINRGNLKNIKIDDIYNADRQLETKFLPPKELQSITTTWGARDANWFFDFPTSAEKVMSFLEQSEEHLSSNIKFDGAIAINTKILESLLETTGPIKLENYGQTINSKNFLPIIQYEVEAGRDKKPGENPKRILSALSPILMDRLNLLDERQKNRLTEKFGKHLEEKNIMVYFRDWRLADVLENIGIAGSVLKLPENFSGDYLAVVNANIAGGKTDAFISQHINLKSRISPDGKITNELSITRSHEGNSQKDWWYKMTNKNYLKILAPENSKLKTVIGNNDPPLQKQIVKCLPASVKCQLDADLSAIEKTANLIEALKAWTGKEFGKTSFAAWFSTPPGKTKTLKVTYENGVQLNIKDGLRYEFIFEKQSGVDGSLEYSITAPPGYIWKESGKEVFEYGTQQIKNREIIHLTLLNPHT